MKKILSVFTAIFIVSAMCIPAAAVNRETPFDVEAKSAVLMEASTGKILYSKNQNDPLPPASVTKVMTLLLIMEAVDEGKLSLTENVQVSEYAASMGGSQVFLEPGEEMSAEDLLKCIVVASANDAAVTLAEKVAGSEEAFVKMMNERAQELSMKSTNFENVTGLDDTTESHVTSAYDIAVMSRELTVKHPAILKYSSIWMDTVRNGEFGLTNTNRLVRFYKGATGLKTGSTAKAGFCISATATRDGMDLIAVIMGSETRDKRNEAAKKLLDWGFANYSVCKVEGGTAGSIKVTGGEKSEIEAVFPENSFLLMKKGGEITVEKKLRESIPAPVKKGDKVGKVIYKIGNEKIGEADITAAQDAAKMDFFGLLLQMLREITRW